MLCARLLTGEDTLHSPAEETESKQAMKPVLADAGMELI